ncbi:hypothetical protein SO802_022145 [Lithocarpus litseifolius]|uniref:Transposase (putative) gypsy type domain-containing protein n=1 Tax=Lithocarpus litseifolius TaxID=425828 RepID=A0AAW2CL71_9ROSI
MISSSEVRVVCPSISTLSARLGRSLGVFPYLENFVFKGSSLSVVLADLLSLLRQSLDWFEDLVSEQGVMSEVRSSELETDWFEDLVKERGVMSEVRSSELETGLSSNDDPGEAEGDTVVFVAREVRAFYALDEVCSLDGDTLSRFKDRFQFLERVRVHPREKDRACHFFPREVCFYEAAFQCGLGFPVHPFLMELLDRFGMAPGQIMPNSWRIMVSCMGIWLAATDGDMIKVDELVYLYRLKSSKEYRYYELVPWERRTRIV